MGARDSLGVGWALGAFGCWGLYRLEGMGVHPWVLRTAWVGWALGFFGCQGSPREAGHQGAPLGARDSLGVVGIGCPWVLGSLYVGFPGRGSAPLGAGDLMSWVGVGYLWVLGVLLVWRVWVRTLGCWGPRELGGCRVPLGAGGPYGMGVQWAAPLGARDSLGLGGCWVPLGAGSL